MFPRLRRIVMKHKKSQQRPHPVCIHGCEQILPQDDPQLAEQFDPDWLHSGMVLENFLSLDRNYRIVSVTRRCHSAPWRLPDKPMRAL